MRVEQQGRGPGGRAATIVVDAFESRGSSAVRVVRVCDEASLRDSWTVAHAAFGRQEGPGSANVQGALE